MKKALDSQSDFALQTSRAFLAADCEAEGEAHSVNVAESVNRIGKLTVTLQQSDTPTLTPSQAKRAAHKAAFATIGQAITAQAWRDRVGEHNFQIKIKPVEDKDISSRLFGPQFRTQQFERTSKRKLV